MIKVIYNKVCGRCVQSEPLTSGMVGQPIHFEYSHDFDGLAATAVFTDGKNTVNVVNPGNECIIPHEVLTTVGATVKVGIYAVKGDELVIPTIYAHIGIVLKGADPSGGISEDPTLPVWAQTQAMIGNLNALETESKENLVLAINEVKQTTDGKQDTINDLEAIRAGAAKGATALQSVPSSYRTAAAQDVIDNGKVDKVTGKGLSSNDYTDADKAKVDALEPVTEQTVSGWGFTKNTGTYSKPTGGIPKADLANDVQASLGKAETALQEHQSLAAYRTAAEQNIIDNGKQDKLIAGENITIAADGKTISATGGGGGGVQPDWNQNDATQPDYVKNRPFYTGNPVETVLVEENTVSFTNPSANIYYGAIPTTIELIAGETYKVSWDGATYECVCELIMGHTAIGNPSIMGAGADTGEPFLIMPLADNQSTDIYTLDTSNSHTISISAFAAAEVVKIPDKYISDTFRDIIIAGNPLQWSDDKWDKYYVLFLSGKLLQIITDTSSTTRGYVSSMFYNANPKIHRISFIDANGNLYSLMYNNAAGELYWKPLLNSNGDIYLRYIQDSTDSTPKYATLGADGTVLTFKTNDTDETPVARQVVLEGDNVSAFTNDAGYLTIATLPKYGGEVV